MYVCVFVTQLVKITINVGKHPEHSISFTVVVHAAHVHFVRQYLFRLVVVVVVVVVLLLLSLLLLSLISVSAIWVV